MLLLFLVLSVKKGFIVFQKRLFSVTSLTLRLLKWRVLDSLKRLNNNVVVVCNWTNFWHFFPYWTYFFNLNLFIIALRRVFVIKGWLLFRVTFCFKGANRSRVVSNARWNDSKSSTEDKCFFSSSSNFLLSNLS